MIAVAKRLGLGLPPAEVSPAVREAPWGSSTRAAAVRPSVAASSTATTPAFILAAGFALEPEAKPSNNTGGANQAPRRMMLGLHFQIESGLSRLPCVEIAAVHCQDV